jgi:translation initiation factor IF-1
MQRFDVVRTEAQVIECVSEVLYRVELSNGHQFLAHSGSDISVKDRIISKRCLPGSKVLVELRAFDLSAGTVLEVLVS